MHYLIYDSGINPENKPEWNLDGKSWLLNANSVNEIAAAENISVYPNPAVSQLTVGNLQSAIQSKLPVELFSIDGKKVFSATPEANELEISTQQLLSGVYVLKVGDVTKKVVVPRPCH